MKTRASIAYLQLKFDEIRNEYLAQTLVLLARVELSDRSSIKVSILSKFIHIICMNEPILLQNIDS